jgi:hypothetical protein
VPDNADADKKIALATIARVYIQLRHSRPEVPSFPASPVLSTIAPGKQRRVSHQISFSANSILRGGFDPLSLL